MTRMMLAAFVLLIAVAPGGASAQNDEIQEIFRLFTQGEMADAARRAQAYVAARPDDPSGHHALGRICVAQARHDEALAHLTRCLELEPPAAWMVAWTHVALGQTHAATGDAATARTHLQKAIDLNATRNATRQARTLLAQLGGAAAAVPESPWTGKPMPEFTLEGLAGERVTPAAMRGRACLYKFGPTW